VGGYLEDHKELGYATKEEFIGDAMRSELASLLGTTNPC
jgi:hypothetical protein